MNSVTARNIFDARNLLVAIIALVAAPLACAAAPAPAAAPLRPAHDVIDSYVRAGLNSNLALRQQTLELQRSQAALDAAHARFFPEVALQASYTRASGGRQIDLPLGTLVNPVYTTLNDLLMAQGRPAEFGQISDSSIPFLQDRAQDTRLTLRQPLYAPAIPAALRVQHSLLTATEYARIALARRLKRDITVGWLDSARAAAATEIHAASVALLQENLRVNESLLRNGKITQDRVLRARAELLAAQQQLGDARNQRSQAVSYLNFLLNRSLDTAIESADISGDLQHTSADLQTLRAAALTARPELNQAESVVAAAIAQRQQARSAFLPTLSLGIDAGIQGEDYRFGSGRNFNTVSLLLNWKIFDAGGRRSQLHDAQAREQQAQLHRDELTQQIQLEVQQSLDRLNTSAAAIATATARADAARAGFRIASRKRNQGVINQVEFLDARTTLTSAELNLNLSRFELLARQAELDLATSAGTLPWN